MNNRQQSEAKGGKSDEEQQRIEDRPSWPYPTILFLYVVIILITPIIGSTIGLILLSGLMLFCLWYALSRKQYEQLREGYPGLTRSDYIVNNLLFPVIVPLILFVVLVLFRLDIL